MSKRKKLIKTLALVILMLGGAAIGLHGCGSSNSTSTSPFTTDANSGVFPNFANVLKTN